MLDSLFAPDTLVRRAAEYILERASKGRWATSAEVARETGASRRTVEEARRSLIAAGLLGDKRTYARCEICGKTAVARGLCGLHYDRARRRGLTSQCAAWLLALVLALPGYPGRWLVLADAEPAVAGGVALCAGGDWPQWCAVEAGGGDVVIDGVQVRWVTWLPGVSR